MRTFSFCVFWCLCSPAVAFAGDDSPCAQPSSSVDLETQLGSAESAWIAMDERGLQDALNTIAVHTLPCLAEVPKQSLAARYHRMTAFERFLSDDAISARSSLQAARNVEPTYAFSDELLPSSVPLRQVWEELEPFEATSRVPEPRDGALVFDGTPGRLRPTEVPSLAQLTAADGTILQTLALQPGDPLPQYRAIPRIRNRLLYTATGLGVAAGALYGAAWASRTSVVNGSQNPNATLSDLESSQAQITGLFVGSVAAGAGTVGFLVGAASVGER